jgi:putative zinc finger/helix-turn-helix YgiT family protein
MKKTKPEKAATAPRSTREKLLPEEACPNCGTLMLPRQATLSLPINGEKVTVPRMSQLKCPNCKEVLLTWQQAGQLHEAALKAYREKYQLLSAEEIRDLRRRFRLTQNGLAELLRLGANTISRWEARRNVQTAAMDVLLRMLQDLPGSLNYLKRRRAA